MDSSLRDEPLLGHMVYEKVISLSKGPGAFKQVARNKQTGELVCIKFVPRGWDRKTAIAHTRALYNHMELSLANHPHIVEMKGAFLTPFYLALVMEYVEGETIERFLEKVGGRVIEGLARFIMQQLLIAVDFCHKRGKVLRDIKLSNILLSISEGQLPLVKLCDFSISKDMIRDSDDQSHPETSALYTAPEAAMGGTYDGRAADLYSCGIVLYVMLFGKHPFMRDSDAELEPTQRLVAMMQRMMKNDVEFPPTTLKPVCSSCTMLIASLLPANPNHRMKMHELMASDWCNEALPEGAGQMNDLFIAESVNLSIEQVAFFKALIKKASVDDGDMDIPTPVVHPPQLTQQVQQQQQMHMQQQLMQAAYIPQGQQQQMYAGTSLASTQTAQQAPKTGKTAANSKNQAKNRRISDATARYIPNQTQPKTVTTGGPSQLQYISGSTGDNNNNTDDVGLGGFMDLLSGPSFAAGNKRRRVPSFLQPTYLQQQLDGGAGAGPSQQQWLSDLEDSIMNIPSEELLAAATVDIRERAAGDRMKRLESVSIIAPRTMSEIERSLCRSSSFMMEFRAAGLTGEIGADGGGGLSRSSLGQQADGLVVGSGNNQQPLLVDPSPFLIDDDKELPVANVASMIKSFDWESFNEAFALPECGARATASAAGHSDAARTASGSSWGRLCKEVNVQMSS